LCDVGRVAVTNCFKLLSFFRLHHTARGDLHDASHVPFDIINTIRYYKHSIVIVIVIVFNGKNSKVILLPHHALCCPFAWTTINDMWVMSRMPDEGDSTRPDDRVNNGVRRAVEIDAANNCASRSAAPLLNHFTITTAGDAPRCHPARALSLSLSLFSTRCFRTQRYCRRKSSLK